MKRRLSNLSISHISSGLPERTISMFEYGIDFGDDEVKRIIKSTGVESVHMAEKDMCTSDYLVAIAKRLMKECGSSGKDFDGLVLVTQTPDYILPATSCIMQHRLGLPNSAVTFDINYGCSGYIYGLYQASLLVSSGSCKKVLVCVGETNIRTIHPMDRANRMVLGDGFSVTIVEQGKNELMFQIHSDGSGYSYLIMEAGGFRLPVSTETAKPVQDVYGHNRWPEYLYMDGMEIMNFALSRVPLLVEEMLADVGWSKEQVGLFAMHQANQLIIQFLAKRLKVSKERMPVSLKYTGNTVSASIPLLLTNVKENFSTEKLKKTILCGFGIGLSWGGVATDLSDTIIHNSWEISRDELVKMRRDIND